MRVTEQQIQALRKRVHDATLEIIRQIGIRQRASEDIAYEKTRLGIPLFNLNIERELRAAVVAECRASGVDESLGLRILSQIMTESIQIQRTIMGDGDSSLQRLSTEAHKILGRGHPVINLSVGEPDFGPPARVILAATRALTTRHVHYAPSQGLSVLRERVAKTFISKQREVTPEEVIITPGGKFALYLALMSKLRQGDEVIIFGPAYPAYETITRYVGGRPVILNTCLEENWNVDIDALADAVSPMTRAIIINSPNNPTGKIIDKTIFSEIAQLARENELTVISDEVYSAYAGRHVESVLNQDCASVMISSFSKTYAMTGFRIGLAISDHVTIKHMTRLQNTCLTSVPEFVQSAALEALKCTKERESYRRIIRERIKQTVKELRRLPLTFTEPEGGLYIFPMIQGSTLDGQVFSERLLREQTVWVTPGCIYGDQYRQFFRMSLCQPMEKIREAINRMEVLLES